MIALSRWLTEAVEAIERWQSGFGPFATSASTSVDDDEFAPVFSELIWRLRNNYPFFHPRYAGQMLKPPHPAAVVGYVAAMLVNPNNHALDGGPATAAMERDCIDALATMFSLKTHLGHLTTSGTIANLEALFVARELHPGRRVVCSVDAHYTHERMGHLLGVRVDKVAVDRRGRLDLDALRTELSGGNVGTVVATVGTTGRGAIDPVHEIVALARAHGARVHVDAAYGGFFALLAGRELDPAPWRAIAGADSVLVDPHKHGLQPYGCGAVLFADPAVGRFYQHDSPYTYFTSADLHLGEISLECSRAGAAAAALWTTLQVLPLTPAGLGAVLAEGLHAAREWSAALAHSEVLALLDEPQLDIVTYHPRRASASEVDAASAALLTAAMVGDDPVFVSALRVPSSTLVDTHPDVETARVLRSVLMKPESRAYVPKLHERLESLVGQLNKLRP